MEDDKKSLTNYDENPETDQELDNSEGTGDESKIDEEDLEVFGKIRLLFLNERFE